MTPAQFDRMLNIGEGRQATGIEVLCWAFTDTAHHRGQAEVYLRVKKHQAAQICLLMWTGRVDPSGIISQMVNE